MSGRQSRRRVSYPTILIACGGESERAYFEDIRKETWQRGVRITVKVYGKAPATIAKKLRGEKEVFDKIYCVIDNEFPSKQIKQLEKYGEVILQTPCFEVWVYIHYCYTAAQLSAKEWLNKIREKLPNYKKGESCWRELKPYLNKACKHAERLDRHHSETSGTNGDPSVCVHRVIDELKTKYGINF